MPCHSSVVIRCKASHVVSHQYWASNMRSSLLGHCDPAREPVFVLPAGPAGALLFCWLRCSCYQCSTALYCIQSGLGMNNLVTRGLHTRLFLLKVSVESSCSEQSRACAACLHISLSPDSAGHVCSIKAVLE